MNAPASSPMRIKGLAAPLLRPLPTILFYANKFTDPRSVGSAAARQVFTAHVRAFRAMMVTLARRAELPDPMIRGLVARCRSLAEAGMQDLEQTLAGFKGDLRRLHDEFGRLLKETAAEHERALRRLFQDETGPLRVLVVYNDQTEPGAENLCRTLEEGCWYESEACHEDLGTGRVGQADLVLLLAGDTPILPAVEQAAADAGLPALVAIGGKLTGRRDNMAALRTAHHYRNRGLTVLSGPLAALRLYQAIDGCRLSAMLEQESLSTGQVQTVGA